MSTNLDTPDLLATATNRPEFSVGELSRAIKGVLEGEFGRVRVRGEISGFKRPNSGHLYFRLKDAEAALDAVCWRNAATRLGVSPQDGLEVIATGRITSYPGRSSYQIIVEQLELAGEGALLKLLEDRRRTLAAEGLFAMERKRPLPYLPAVVGVVTSPTGAVIRDILHRLRERCPRHVLLWPVQVQGEGAAEQVAKAVQGFNALPTDGSGPVPRPDVLIVARGGGSLEDLWAFNEEVAVRAVAASGIPVIAAVGHETDTTLIDFAADLRAPTPTAAAEKAVPVLSDLVLTLGQLGQRMAGASWRGLDQCELQLRHASRGLPDPVQMVELAAQRVDDLTERLGLALRTFLASAVQRVRGAAGSLRHPREVLALKDQTLTSCSRALIRAAEQQLRTAEHSVAHVNAERRLPAALARTMVDAERRLIHAGALLSSYSYERVLDRGFVLVRGPDGPVTSAAEATPGLAVTLQFKGSETRGATIDRDGEPSEAAKPKRVSKRRDGRQGRLL